MTSAFGTKSTFTPNTTAIQVGNYVRDGDEFMLITRQPGSTEVSIWSSGTREEAADLYRTTAQKITETVTGTTGR